MIDQIKMTQWTELGGQATRQLRSKLLPKMVNILLVLALAYLLAGLLWSIVRIFYPGGEAETLQVESTDSAERQGQAAQTSIAWKEFALFGAEPDPTAVAPQPKPAAPRPKPAEPVRVKLYGTLASSDPAKSQAVLSVKDAKVDIYRPGAELQQGVMLKEVRGWSVLLDVGGDEQVVWMIEEPDRQQSMAPPSPAAEQAAAYAEENRITDTAVVEKLEGYRQELGTNPVGLTDKIRASVVQRDGAPYGMRLRPGTDRALLGELGLRAGDILIALNGTALNDVANLPDVIAQLRSGQEYVLDIERGGNRQEVRVVIGQ